MVSSAKQSKVRINLRWRRTSVFSRGALAGADGSAAQASSNQLQFDTCVFVDAHGTKEHRDQTVGIDKVHGTVFSAAG